MLCLVCPLCCPQHEDRRVRYDLALARYYMWAQTAATVFLACRVPTGGWVGGSVGGLLLSLGRRSFLGRPGLGWQYCGGAWASTVPAAAPAGAARGRGGALVELAA